MKDKNWQRRVFVLSSFTRLNIKKDSKVMEFVEELIFTDWIPSLISLNDVDNEINKMYFNYLRDGRIN